MTRSDLVEELAALLPFLMQRDAEQAVKALQDAIVDALVQGQRIEIRGFGSFSIHHRRSARAAIRAAANRCWYPPSVCPTSNRARPCVKPLTLRPPPRMQPSSEGLAMKYLVWLLKAAIFFTLFAFALNNQHSTTVHWFFGQYWSGPLVLIVLAAFCLGLLTGILVMLPRWWQARQQAHAAASPAPAPAESSAAAAHPTTLHEL